LSFKVLKAYRRLNKFDDVKKERSNSVRELRSSIDYPSFNAIDVDWFFSIWELGHIISLPKPTIKREIEKFRRLLIILCDEQIDIATRYDMSFTKTFKINGVSEALVSKILAIHRPNLYFVRNGKSAKALKKYEIEIPRGLSKGEKYKITCIAMRKICLEANMNNLAILDHYLYFEGSES
jgi:hypothetical protein